MKDKKILNICLLSFGLIALITFILPLKKYTVSSNDSGFLKVMFYVLNAVLVISLITLIVLSIFNLFKDCYKAVKVMETMALVGFAAVFLVMLMFASSSISSISIGYILVCVEMFFCANFSQMFRLFSTSKLVYKKPKGDSVKNEKKTERDNNAVIDSGIQKSKIVE